MRARALLLPFLLLVSPGHGVPPGTPRAARPEAWTALGWSLAVSRRVNTPAPAPTGVQSPLRVDSTGSHLACPMPVVPLVPARALHLARPPMPGDRLLGVDSISGHHPFRMRVLPSGCWNPLFLPRADSVRLGEGMR
jgi:hypothetical protein